MYSEMQVRVRILTLQARQQIRELEAEIRRLERSVGRQGRGFTGMATGTEAAARASRNLTNNTRVARRDIDATNSSLARMLNTGTKAGNQLQWTGRQLQYNFALPLALAGGFAIKSAMDTERAMVRVRKVYGDSTMAAGTMRAELSKLEDVFSALSNRFGVHREEVIGIAGDWAAAGASGAALARGVNLTLTAMVIGEIEAAEATQALIAIQAQYGVTTQTLTQILADLNVVENETGVRMRDLIQSMSRAAAVARMAGVDHQHLAAFVAALVPAAGTAATAGNGLKTMITRLMAPTNEAADAMKEMGINVYDASWQSLNASERFEKMASGFQKLTEGQRIFISNLVAGKWQISKFAQVMADVSNENGYYKKALDQTNGSIDTMRILQNELNEVLSSSPQKWRQTGVIMQNALADVMIPLLPYIVAIAQKVAELTVAFSEMNPYAQGAIIALAGFLLVFGPLLRYIGSSITLFASLGDVARVVTKPFVGLARALHLVGPAAAAGAAEATAATQAGATAQAGILSRSRAAFVGGTAAAWKQVSGVTKAGWSRLGAIDASANAARHASQSRWDAMRTAQNGAHAGAIQGIWYSLWSRLIMGQEAYNAASGASTARHAAATTAVEAKHAGAKAGLWASMWAAMTTTQVAAHAAQTGHQIKHAATLTSVTASTLAGLLAIERGYQAKVSAAWTSTRAWILGGEAGWGARMRALQGSFIASAIRGEHKFHTTRKAVWTSAQQWLLGGESRFRVAMANLSTIGQARHQAVESGFLAKSRASWAAYWSSLVVMQRSAAVKMVATDAAMKSKMMGKKWMTLARLGWAGLLLGILGLVYYFRDDIAAAFTKAREWVQTSWEPLVSFFADVNNWIVEQFYKLPQGIQDAFIQVVKIVAWAGQKVYDLFSWLNPFARHSPSLVESVNDGMAEIKRAYASVGNVGALFAKAVADLKAFKAAAAALGRDEWSDQRVEVAENMPQMLGLFNTLVSDVNSLNNVLNQQRNAVDAQKSVVNNWQVALDNANLALDRQQDKLDDLKDQLDLVQATYDSHKQAMEDYANAPLVGMQAMSDAIFENEIAQKRLQLAMMDWEEQNGPLEDYQNRLAALRGDIEMLMGTASDLRGAGAGSDVLGPIQDQIGQMEAAAKAMEDTVNSSPIAQMTTELEKLQRQGQRLALEQSLAFDPLTRQIEQAANMTKELTFQEIIGGIRRERIALNELQPALDAANQSVRNQEAIVKAATAARDQISEAYDVEKVKLQKLEDEYSQTEALIRDIESALRDMGSAARQAGEDARKAAAAAAGEPSMFDAAAVADFPDVGGMANIGREGTDAQNMADLDKMLEELNAETARMFAGFDFFGPVKGAWNSGIQWMRDNALPLLQPTADWIRQQWESLFDGQGVELSGIIDKLSGPFEWFAEKIEYVRDFLGAMWRLIDEDVNQALSEFWSSIQDVWKEIAPEVAKFAELWEPLKDAWQEIWPVLKLIIAVGLGILLLVWKTSWAVLANVVGPILDTVVGVISNVLQVMRGIVQLTLALINGDWKEAFWGLYNIVAGTFGAIWALIEGVARTVWGIIAGLVEGIFGFFKWLYDELVGHSIIPDIVNGIIAVFSGLWGLANSIWDNVLKPIWDFFVAFQKVVIGVIVFVVGSIFTVLRGLWGLATWVWDNVLKPVVNVFVDMWSGRAGVREILDTLVRVFWNIVDGLKGLPQALWDNVLKPIWSKFKDLVDAYIKPLVNAFIRLVAGLGNNLGEGIARGINVAINAVNKLIEGLNWIGSHVPGLSFSIDTIGTVSWPHWNPPQFAAGGRLPVSGAEGVVTNGPRAIVGEGRRGFPEYVIPSDPRYRTRARDLLFKAMSDVAPEMTSAGGSGTMRGAVGGWWDDVKDAGGVVKDAAGNAVDYVRRGAVTAALAGPLKAFDVLMKAVSSKPEPVKDMVIQKKNDFYNWAKGVDDVLPKTPPPGIMGHLSVGGTGWRNIDDWLTANGNVRRHITSTFRPGDPGNHGSGRAVDYSVSGHGNRGYSDPGLRAIFDALLPVAGTLRELILAGAPFNIKNGQQVPGYAWGQPGLVGNHWNHVHAAAKNGAIVQKRVGGRLVRVGEGRHDEAIVPLPPGMRKPFGDSDKKEVHFYSPTLVFPNIKNAEDAEDFVRNLSDLAG